MVILWISWDNDCLIGLNTSGGPFQFCIPILLIIRLIPVASKPCSPTWLGKARDWLGKLNGDHTNSIQQPSRLLMTSMQILGESGI